MTELKRCSRGDDCVHPDGCWQPATSEYFHRARKEKGGFQYTCKSCNKKYRQENKEHIAEYRRKYYRENKDLIIRNTRQYSQENKEWLREYHRQYREDNKESILERERQYRENNKGAIAERDRRYRKKNKKTYRLRLSRYRARKRSLPYTLTDSQWQQALEHFNYCCAVCGTPEDMFIKLQADHWIPLSSDDCTGTIASNIVPLCGGSEFDSHTGCNPSKGNKDALEWLVQTYGDNTGAQIFASIQSYLNSFK